MTQPYSEAVEQGAKALRESPGYIGGEQHALEDAHTVLTASGLRERIWELEADAVEQRQPPTAGMSRTHPHPHPFRR